MVYSSGNWNVCEPAPPIFGSVPALGMTFQDKVNVIFLLVLKIHIRMHVHVSLIQFLHVQFGGTILYDVPTEVLLNISSPYKIHYFPMVNDN